MGGVSISSEPWSMKQGSTSLTLWWAETQRAVTSREQALPLCPWVCSAVPELCRGLCVKRKDERDLWFLQRPDGLGKVWPAGDGCHAGDPHRLESRNVPSWTLSWGSPQNNSIPHPQAGSCVAQVGLRFQDLSNPPTLVSGVVETRDAHYYLILN